MSTQPPVEDINVIVSRFQAWAGAQAPSRTREEAVRELTYEEAIRPKRRRNDSEAPSPEAENLAPAPLGKAERRNLKEPTEPTKRVAIPCHTKPAPAEELTPSPAEARLVVPYPRTFRQVLAESVSILPASLPQRLTTDERRAAALSLRISTSEHALLKTRAAEANLSVSCYLRNCVLEVESLRMQLARTREELQAMQMQPTIGVSAFASCIRMVRRIFFGKTTTLTVRA